VPRCGDQCQATEWRKWPHHSPWPSAPMGRGRRQGSSLWTLWLL